jgi:putative transposase
MRTIKRISPKLNKGKFEALQEIASAYAREKQEHVPVYHDDALFGAHRSERVRRDELVKLGYSSGHGVSGRMWKLAQKDAYEAVLKHWASLAEEIKPLIGAHQANKDGQAPCGTAWTEAQLRYAYWLIYTPRRMAELMSGQSPVPKHFNIEPGERKVVRNYLRRVIRRKCGSRPRVKLQRSFALDPDMYDIKTTAAGTQVIAITGLVPRQRIRIPLTGHTVISGNIRVVLDHEKQRVAIHYTAGLKAPGEQTGEVVAVDAGLTEVFTDDEGNKYGQGLGKLIYDESDRILEKNRKRNKLYQVAEKHSRKGRRQKARNIRKFNLGKKKQNEKKRKNRIELERQINTALNEINRKRQPSILVTEKLDIRGKAKSKRMSRQVSLWPRGTLKERTEFKASAAGCRRKQVNPAYTSQTCPLCWFVDGKNRNGDRFKCLNCGHEQDADQVAAINLKARLTDPDITLWTPKEQVKAILLARFAAPQGQRSADLETVEPRGEAGTVAGRTQVATSTRPDGTLSTERETTNAIPTG